jgi:hypothetical protein
MAGHLPGRRSIFAGLGAAAAAVAGLASTTLRAQAPGSGFSPSRHGLDRWLDEIPGQHRVFIDSNSAGAATNALLYAVSLFETNEEAYGLDAGEIAIVVCFRHRATPFGYSDAMWSKYGSTFSTMMGLDDPATANPALPGPRGVEAVGGFGARFAVCARATRNIAGQVARSTGQSPEDVRAELMANAVPNGRFVPAGVVAATRSQEYGYSLVTAV